VAGAVVAGAAGAVVVAGGVVPVVVGVVAVLGQNIQASRMTTITAMMMYHVLLSIFSILPAATAD
jgi:hypothetical protein